jgi:hypothetical protein
MMPSTTQSTVGGDEVRARDGTTCKQGTYNGPTFDTGVSSGNAGTTTLPGYTTTPGSNQTLYARIVIPFGKTPDRLDCTRLYSLEIERLQLEIDKLKQSGSAAITIN